MTIDLLQEVLLWCTIINLGLFILSFVILTLAHDLVHRYHGKWYKLSVETFDAIIYSVMAFYKICIIFFNVVPYVALRIVG